MKKTRRVLLIVTLLLVAAALSACGKNTEKLITEYMEHIEKQEYEAMYEMIDPKASDNISKEDFIQRNSAIYEGIEAKNIKIEIVDSSKTEVEYKMSFETLAGDININNTAEFTDDGKLVWKDGLIFPSLEANDKVRVEKTEAQRGKILDRNGTTLAVMGTASSVGVVPEKLEDKETAIQQIASILGLEVATVKNKIEADWVRDGYFVPIKTIANDDARSAELLKIPGVMIQNEQVRVYPLGAAAAHLVGYVQGVTADDLKKHKVEGYSDGDVIGRTGAETLYEKELKGADGYRIYIRDQFGYEKQEIADLEVEHGSDITLTIDAGLQQALYEQYKTDQSCSVAMDPYTGEVMALVSTPSFDSNTFVLGLSDESWKALNEAPDMPLYNRFRQVWCPGSTMKPITAAIGLETGAIKPEKNYGNEGLKWQKDGSWGDYYVTTLHEYEPDILANALIYSDNIYFAKAALRIGGEDMASSLDDLGFGKKIPFEIRMNESQYSNNGKISKEIQLADTGYGQGEVLVNPLHLASLYTAFVNEGNVVDPYLTSDAKKDGFWISGAFSKTTAASVLEDMKKVISDPNGTGHAIYRSDMELAGKTGTAEIKASQSDTTGTEIGWFAVMTTDTAAKDPVLVVSMVENVKDKGGSTYVVNKTKAVLDGWFK